MGVGSATRAIRAGMSVDELETPVLVIDLDSMERNLDSMMRTLADSGVGLRPHLKTAKSPAIAHLMLQAGAVGICCAKLSEVEVMANAGIGDILLTSEVAGVGKIERLVALAQRLPAFKAVVDNAATVDRIAEVARAAGVTVSVMIELDVNTGRSGIPTAAGVLALAQHVADTEGVTLAGIHAYAGHAQVRPEDVRTTQNNAAMAVLAETLDLLAEHNITPGIVSGGGTGTAAADVTHGLPNEVQAGSFLLMDTAYRDAGAAFENALRCRTTIISTPTADRAVCDAGQKTMSHDAGPPEVIGRPGLTYRRGSDEHGGMVVDPDAIGTPLQVGEVIDLLPSHVCTTINLHDVLVGVRHGKVETIWPIETRGHIW